MSEISEVFEDVKKATGDKGFLILGAVVVGVFAINLLKNDSTSDTSTLVPASGYSGYPTVETNANVIIDSLQKSIDYSQGEIEDSIKDSQTAITDTITDGLGELGNNMNTATDDMKKYLDSNFTATNDYINKGLEQQKNLINMNQSQLKSELDSINANQIQTKNDLDKHISTVDKQLSKVNKKQNYLEEKPKDNTVDLNAFKIKIPSRKKA